MLVGHVILLLEGDAMSCVLRCRRRKRGAERDASREADGSCGKARMDSAPDGALWRGRWVRALDAGQVSEPENRRPPGATANETPGYTPSSEGEPASAVRRRRAAATTTRAAGRAGAGGGRRRRRR